MTLILNSCIMVLPEGHEATEHNTLPEEATLTTTEENTLIPEPETLFSDTDEFSMLKEKTDAICASYGAVGVQAAIIKDGKLYGTYEYGIAEKAQGKKVTSDTKFRVASLSKLVTDMVFLRLCEEGLTDINGDISTYLGFAVRSPYYPDTAITPAMLMSHTSSIIDTESFLNSRLTGSSSSIETLLSSASAFSGARPGSSYSYSNFSVALIGSICEKVTGINFDDLAKKYIFEPSETDASYTASGLKDPSLVGALYGSGGYSVEQQLNERFHPEIGRTHHLVQGNLTISAKDYITIAAALCNEGVTANGVRILNKSSIDTILNDPVGFGHVKNSYVIEGKTLCTHTGSNFGMFSAFAIDPESGNGVAVLTSGAPGTKYNSADIYDICLEIIRVFYPD